MLEYPSQIPDVGYGYLIEHLNRSLLNTGSVGKIHVPSSDALAQAWIFNDFDDSSWIPATNGIGFELNSPSLPLVMADSVADFSGKQGQNSWRYGYYVRTLDCPFWTPIYSDVATAEIMQFETDYAEPGFFQVVRE